MFRHHAAGSCPLETSRPTKTVVERVLVSIACLSLMLLALPAESEGAESLTCDGGPRRTVPEDDLRSPPRDDGPTEIRAGLFVEDLREIDAVTASYRFRGVVTVTWCDPRLAFDPAVEGTDTRVFFGPAAAAETERIFTARGFVVNQVEEIRITEQALRVGRDGTVSRDINVSALLSADFDLRRFPFDRQHLEFLVEPFLWSERHVVFIPDHRLTGFADDFDIPEWRITGVRADVSTVDVIRSSEPFSRLTLTIDVQRKAGFYLWKVLLPLFLIVALSWSIFWMVDERFGIRVRTSATGILTVVAYQFVAGQNLPRVGYLTLIDKMMVISFLLLAITVLESYLVSRCMEDDRDKAVRIDKTARWLFPLTYVGLLALTYVTASG